MFHAAAVKVRRVILGQLTTTRPLGCQKRGTCFVFFFPQKEAFGFFFYAGESFFLSAFCTLTRFRFNFHLVGTSEQASVENMRSQLAA